MKTIITLTLFIFHALRSLYNWAAWLTGSDMKGQTTYKIFQSTVSMTCKEV